VAELVGQGPDRGDVDGSRCVHRLILWDIDGTLVSCGASGREALEAGALAVLRRVAPSIWGPKSRVPDVVMSGKTDPQIVGEILTLAGMEDSTLEKMMPLALEEAERSLASKLDRIKVEGHVHRGVAELLERMARTSGVRQTLLTGNLEANAYTKVAAFGLEGFFDMAVGAYGTDNRDRDLLVPICLGKVRALRGESYRADEVWVIGDTPRDLSCARAGGARCLIVGTGKEGFDAVRDLEADVVIEDLTDVERVSRVLLGG
jgi:phosphoglycolate phosphatase